MSDLSSVSHITSPNVIQAGTSDLFQNRVLAMLDGLFPEVKTLRQEIQSREKEAQPPQVKRKSRQSDLAQALIESKSFRVSSSSKFVHSDHVHSNSLLQKELRKRLYTIMGEKGLYIDDGDVLAALTDRDGLYDICHKNVATMGSVEDFKMTMVSDSSFRVSSSRMSLSITLTFISEPGSRVHERAAEGYRSPRTVSCQRSSRKLSTSRQHR